jgi:arylsulfatase A-like enzyme
MLDLAGAAIPQNINGKSMVPLLKDPRVIMRDEILFEHWPTGAVDEEGIGSMIPEFHAVRTKEWKYVEYSTGETELYDLVNDPYELVNVVSDKKNAQVIEELKLRLLALMKE